MNTSLKALLVLCALASPAFAKPIYITVPRTYGTNEPAVVDVAFSGKEPVELRVLKPKDVDAFVRDQANLRRAYTEPPVQANPGRYLARGINGIQSPAYFWRRALKADFRKGVSPALPEADDSRTLRSRLAQTAEKLVGIPPSMELVRSEWLNLDLGGSDSTFSVPGFDEWDWGGGGFQERRVSLPKLPAGVYVLQLVQGKVEGQVVLVVTDLAVQVKQTDGEVLVRVAGRDQQAKANARVTLHVPGGKPVSGTTDAKGEVLLAATSPKLVATAQVGTDLALIDTDFYSTLAVAPDVFIYSDRPIYKPGDEISFRGVVRRPASFLARLFTPKKRSVKVALDGGASRTVVIDDFGAFSGTLQVDPKAEAGVVRLVAELDDQEHQAEARVREYVKPTFFVELLSDDETITPGKQVTAKLRARRYAGGVPKDGRYEVFLLRTRLESPTWVDDAGLGGEGSAVTYGSASTTEGSLSQQDRLYSSLVARQGEWSGDDPWSTAAKLDENGEAEITVDVPALEAGDEHLPWKYVLSVRARDDQGTFANASKSYFLSDVEVLGGLQTSAKLVKTGEEARLAVRATTLGGKAYGETGGKVTFVLRKADGTESQLGEETFRTDATGIWRGAVPTKKIGAVLARTTITDRKGKSWEGETRLLVAGTAGEPVAAVPALTLETTESTLGPGDMAELVALFPDAWGPGGNARGPVWLTLSGTSLFQTTLVDVDGSTFLHRFPIEKRFGSAVYASLAYPTASGRWEERTTAIRIIPKERALMVQLAPAQPEVKPLGRQEIDLRVVDHEGRGVRAQLSVGVVDKAIYALQAEFRPHVLDFFYPVTRNNVATFQSAEFQGYGHGEALALRGLLPWSFAAVKPPTKKQQDRDRDTAYWNPAVTTDAEGHARVAFDMPSNQTLWVVTAVAADASGRFGEGTTEFASRGGMTLVASLPQFLRAGDVAEGSVRVARGASEEGAKAGGAKKLDVSLVATGAAEATVRDSIVLEKDGEKLIPVKLTANRDGAVQVQLDVKGDDALKDRRLVAVRPNTIDDTVTAFAWGGGALALAVPAGAEVRSVELTLRPSTVEVTLASLRDLMTYPYGCLEQLVSTTVPNVAVYQALQKMNALAKLDPDSRALLEEARSRSVQGTARILDLSLKGGGFTWFGGYSTPSPAMTLVALDGLTYAAEAGLVAKDDPRLASAATWISAQELPPSLDATRTWVLARYEGTKAAPRVRSFLERVNPDDPYAAALGILSADAVGIATEPAVAARVGTLVEASRKHLAGLDRWAPNDDGYWTYPLRRVGLTAIVRRAASRGETDVAAARHAFIELLSTPGTSTFDRGTALLHGLWLLEHDAKELRATTPPTVKAAAGDAKLVPFGTGFRARLDPKSTGATVSSFDGVASLVAQIRIPAEKAESVQSGMTIERRYYALRGSTRVALAAGDKVTQGEDVYVELVVDARADEDLRGRRSAYSVVEDSVPAGFVTLDEDQQYRGAPFSLPLGHEAIRKRTVDLEKVTFFLEEPAWWSASPRTVGYVMRAQFPGSFVAPAATIEDMYAHDVRGRGTPARLEITASQQTP